MSMKKLKRVLPFSLAIILASVSLPVTALADSAKVVTLGANLSDEQKASMYKYFGTSADQVDTIEVTNTDERKYMEGIATESQIGTRTYSCSYADRQRRNSGKSRKPDICNKFYDCQYTFNFRR